MSPSSPSPSPTSLPLPALQTDLSSSSSSSSTSGSCLDFHRTSSAPPTRRIRFAPLPDPRRDLFDHDIPQDDPHPLPKPPPQPAPAPDDPHDDPLRLSPSLSPASTLSSTRSTPTIRTSPTLSSKHASKLLRPFSFLRRVGSSSPNRSPLAQSASLPSSRNPSPSSLTRSSSSVPSSPYSHSAKLPAIATADVLSLGTRSFFRSRSGSPNVSPLARASSPPPKSLDPAKSLLRSASTGSSPGVKLGNGKRDWGQGATQPRDAPSIAGSGPKKRRASSSALVPGAAGGRHASSTKMLPGGPSTAPAPPKKHVKMLNGRVYGAKRYAAQTLANPFANVREEPEFVEWGYGGMGSVHASAGIANDVWKGLQRSERGGALLSGSSFGPSSPPAAGPVAVGGGRGSGAHATSSTARRKMSDNVPECSMGNVVDVGPDEDDGSGMGWVRRRRAEREAKTRLEQGVKELEKKVQEGRKSGDSIDASMYASTTSTNTSLTACTSVASTELTTPTTSPLTSRSPSLTDLLASPPLDPSNLQAAPSRVATGAQSSKPDASPAHLATVSKDEHEHHVLTAVRMSPNISSPSHKHGHSVAHGRTPPLSHALSQLDKNASGEGAGQLPPLSPVDTEGTRTSANSSSEDEDVEPGQGSVGEEEQDDVDDNEEEAQDIQRKTVLGAGVEKISRHVDVEAR